MLNKIYDISVAVKVDDKKHLTQSFVFEEVKIGLDKVGLKVVDLKVEERR